MLNNIHVQNIWTDLTHIDDYHIVYETWTPVRRDAMHGSHTPECDRSDYEIHLQELYLYLGTWDPHT